MENETSLKLELATMRVMIYSLQKTINTMFGSVSSNEAFLKDLGDWEKECENTAKVILKRMENENESRE